MSRVRTIAVVVARLLLAGVFVVAAVSKLRDPTAFAREIANYQFFPELAPHLAATLPTTELVAALAILLPMREVRRAGALALVALLAVFLVGITSVIARGVDIDCGCFGAGSGSVGPLTVARNLGLAALALYLLRLDSSGSSALGASDSVSPEAGAREGRPG